MRETSKPNAVKDALEVVGLPYKDKKVFSKYSLGMKQRLDMAEINKSLMMDNISVSSLTALQ